MWGRFVFRVESPGLDSSTGVRVTRELLDFIGFSGCFRTWISRRQTVTGFSQRLQLSVPPATASDRPRIAPLETGIFPLN